MKRRVYVIAFVLCALPAGLLLGRLRLWEAALLFGHAVIVLGFGHLWGSQRPEHRICPACGDLSRGLR